MNGEFGIVTLVQCRAGSNRLKGKALRALSGRPMLQHVLERAEAIGYPVVLATSVNKRDNAVAKLGKKLGVPVYRGDEQDVLGRLSGAAKAAHARIVIRITGDCPFFDPAVAREVLELYIQHGHVIATNDTNTSGWPDGMDIEVFQASDLHEAASISFETADREHVTPWIRRHLTHVILPGPEDRLKMKLSVDTPDDYARAQAIAVHLVEGEFGWRSTFEAARATATDKHRTSTGAARTTSVSRDPAICQETAPAPVLSVPPTDNGRDLRLPPNARGALKREGLSLEAAAMKTDEELAAIRGIGQSSIDKIRKAFGP